MRFSGIILALTLISILTPAFNVQIVKAESVSHQLILYTSTRDGVIRVFLNGSKQILEHVRSGYSLEILGNRIYMNQYPGYISVYTTEGVFLKNINIPSSVSYFITFVVLPDERIALLDNENDKVYFIDSLGNFITKVDILEAPDNHLQNLDGIVINNKLIISEDGNKHIIQIDLMTYKKTIFKDMSKIPEVWLGAITYSNGYYYVCGPSSIYKFSENGDVSKIAEIPDYNIVGIVVVDDYAYVSVNFGGKIYKVDLRSGISEVLTSNLNYPLDLEAQILSETLPPTLTLFEPQISGLTVTINGVATPGYEGASITGIAPHCFHWDWGDGNSEDHCFPATHTYSSAGTYTITVTAYQSDGLSTTKTLSVKVEAENKPPTAYIDSISPNPAYEGQTISFSGHGYDPDGKIAECDWRADGRVLSSSCSFSTSLPPGKYTIYFRVKDDKGAWSKWVTETLEVKAKQKEEIPKEGAEKLSELARGKSAFFRSLAEFIDKKTDPRKYLDQFASDLRNLGEFLGKPPENVEEASKKALKDFLLKIIDPNGVIDTADALGKISTVTAYAFMESADVNFWYVIWTNEPLKSDLKAVAEEMNKAADLYDEEANCWEGITKGKCDIDHLKNILNREKDQLIKLKATVNEKIENILSVFRNPSPEVVLNDYKKVVEGDVLKYELPSPPYPCETVEISIEQVPKPAKNFWEFWITDPSYEIEIYPYYYYYPSSFQCQKDEKPLTSRPGACLVNRSLTYNTKSIFGSSMSVTWSVKDLYPLGTFEYDVLGLVIRVKDFGGDNTFTFWTDEGIKEAQIAVKMVYKSSGKYIQLYSFGAQQLENLRSNLITILDKYLDTINNTLTKL
ncbi:PKD domain-containing protein [Candidatus Methanodesulfokora washburnensis]|uniref:PKD domain-containing protein n=1 Tax=Candidatus Methanodesulfokora washburnensis TaxID=2478471 RepID=A0A429GHP6_9CREN|nr:PKD domain-containing protein [Candidatus Methanodesulfokores washburnensis]RSN73423.1 PKD domain-containing protein [Candidatus Methanodesulfokores washburnensis]